MEIFVGSNGFYGIPDIMEDFKNHKARRNYEKELRRVEKQIKRLNSSPRARRRLEELLEKPKKCPLCGSRKLIGWGTYKRYVRTYFSKRVRTISVKRYKCKRCKSTGGILPKFLCKYRRYSNKALRDMVDFKLWSYAGYRKVAKWRRIHGSSHTTIIREIIKLAPYCRDALKNILCRFSSIVCIDEVYFRRVKGEYYMGITAVDARYGRIIFERTYMLTGRKGREFGSIACEDIAATKTDGIKGFINELLKRVVPKVIITDDKAGYGYVINNINKRRDNDAQIKHFFCTFHIKMNINKILRAPGKLKLSEKFETLKTQLMEVFEADSLPEARLRLEKVLARAKEFIGTGAEKIFKKLAQNKARLFPYLEYGIPRTNNPIEFYYSFVKKFQHVSRKFSSFRGISSLLSVFALFYNFMPKMEGKNKGITPLQIAKWNHRIDMYAFIGYPQCIDISRAAQRYRSIEMCIEDYPHADGVVNSVCA